jgi:hypothetical protein
MNAIAKNLNVLRGALSRWILPYDNNTRIESQCSTPHSVVENMPEEFRGKLTERQVRHLVQSWTDVVLYSPSQLNVLLYVTWCNQCCGSCFVNP